METRQRYGTAAIPPWTADWTSKRQLGFGVVALIPLALLIAGFVDFALFAGGIGLPYTSDAVPLLFYTHVGAQFITLLVFGHLMIGNPQLSSGTKLVWGVAFLFAAPFAIPTYWLLHVWHSEAQMPSESTRIGPHDRQIHVYDFDYAEHRPRGVYRREDGSVAHHIDVTPRDAPA